MHFFPLPGEADSDTIHFTSCRVRERSLVRAGNTGIHTSSGLPRTKHPGLLDQRPLQTERRSRQEEKQARSSMGNSHSLVNLVQTELKQQLAFMNESPSWLRKTLVVIVLEERTDSQT